MAALGKVDANQPSSVISAAEFITAQNERAMGSTIKRVNAGETLFVEGDPARHCFQVVSGVIKEYNTLIDGRRQIADFYSIGEIFGLSEIDQYLHTAEAISDSTVRYFSRETYLRAISASPQLSTQFMDSLMTRLHRSRERAIMLGRMNAIQRVSAFLLRLASDNGSPVNIKIFMSRQDIADRLGLTIETVCRALTELKRVEIIAMPAARLFTIPDIGKLDDIAHGSEFLH